jgi:hypothetical protein
MTLPLRYHLVLTPHQRAALLTVITDYMSTPDPLEVSVDAATGEELEIASLIVLVMDALPVEG